MDVKYVLDRISINNLFTELLIILILADWWELMKFIKTYIVEAREDNYDKLCFSQYWPGPGRPCCMKELQAE